MSFVAIAEKHCEKKDQGSNKTGILGKLHHFANRRNWLSSMHVMLLTVELVLQILCKDLTQPLRALRALNLTNFSCSQNGVVFHKILSLSLR